MGEMNDKKPRSILHKLETYGAQQQRVPSSGRHILANFTEDTVVVYQAFHQEIARYAVERQQFVGCPQYSMERMTWFKTNFMWMMYRCGWCTKDANQARVLAIHLTREGFDAMLSMAVGSQGGHENSETARGPRRNDPVRLQWDPDHSPSGGKKERRAIQLGIRGEAIQMFHRDWIVLIEDITDELVIAQRDVALRTRDLEVESKSTEEAAVREGWANLEVPIEDVYVPRDTTLARRIGLTGFDDEEDDSTDQL